MSILIALYLAFGFMVFVLGMQSLLFVPLSLAYRRWKRRLLASCRDVDPPSVSVVVPAYNEEQTIALSVNAILQSDYPSFEVIVVNDGSTDATEQCLEPFIRAQSIVYLRQPNGGKASALNAGIAHARGDIIVFTDADSLMLPDTIARMAMWFSNPDVQAVSGNDAPVAPATALQKLLAITTHIGSGLVRRALSVAGVLPVISGNNGAVRASVLKQVGGFDNIWGEDLDLTFKLHEIGARIVFDPDAMVLCEVPRTFGALWRQRVRWTRSFIRICATHRKLFFTPAHRPFSLYLPLNYLNLIAVPVLQFLTLLALPFVLGEGVYRPGGAVDVIAFTGIATFLAMAAFSTIVDRAPRDLSYLPVFGLFILPVSYFLTAVVLHSIGRELVRAREHWSKSERRRLADIPAARRRPGLRIGLPAIAIVAAAVVFVSTRPAMEHPSPVPVSPASPSLSIATHFDAWTRPADAISSVLGRNDAGIISSVGVGVGRYEWNFFRWEGHEELWSNDQRYADVDLLDDATTRLHSQGKSVVAILDVFSPNYLRQYPRSAAVDINGQPSSEQVCFAELVEGDFGGRIRELTKYLASHYSVDAIALTELDYNRYCYDDRCLHMFRDSTGHQDWPRNMFGSIDRNDDRLGEWRSRTFTTFLRAIADTLHRYGKKLLVDVPLHYDRMAHQGRESGLFYPYVLDAADGIIVWDYFYLDGRSPETSREVAQFFSQRYDPSRVILSIGLWGKEKPVTPGEAAEAVAFALDGGARNLWITPNHLITQAHWDSLLSRMR